MTLGSGGEENRTTLKAVIALACQLIIWTQKAICIMIFQSEVNLSQPVPTPDTGIITHSYKDAAVSAEAGLSNGSSTLWMCKSCAPVQKKTKKCHSYFLSFFLM